MTESKGPAFPLDPAISAGILRRILPNILFGFLAGCQRCNRHWFARLDEQTHEEGIPELNTRVSAMGLLLRWRDSAILPMPHRRTDSYSTPLPDRLISCE